ncbi:hypothetical protein CONPUDRAFT_120715 [Coniophora puteana RWD-64-598 SS2]|uniref:Uncharacterized protein n=1 Tax=Coniophora puteana (strain RWD-64-598) TaxID=741705 RepID=A0A5M3MU33_CONPW|nr:uncharacterized protein CONPUDRAFT_120715 [Coniophora puteana RWD-64-598 SS2]EIW82616.1 hypothetical protein CONPUDRAFT_120715 [Coniophora puteana RWD-64-598 SS2]
MKVSSAVILAGAGFASAQSLSSQCQSTLASIATSSEGSCLNLAGLIPLATANSSSTSVISPINSWLSGVCSVGACSNQTLSDVVTNVTSGCSSDLQGLGISSSNAQEIIPYVQEAYPVVRQIACLQDTTTSQNCVTETLYGIQNATTTLSLTNIVGLFSQLQAGQVPNIPKNVTCSDCTHAAYTIASQSALSSYLSSGTNSSVASYCGGDFTNGQTPSDVKETASSGSSSGSSGSADAIGVPAGAAFFVALGSLFAML